MRALLALFVGVAGLAVCDAAAQPLVADLSSHRISITSNYVGQDVVVFGAREDDGEVVVVLVGPIQDQVVRKKGRIAGLWVTRAQLVLQGLPTFYAVAASAPLAEIASEAVLTANQIGAERLNFFAPAAAEPEQAREFGAAFIRLQQRADLYSTEPIPVLLVGGPLFRTEFHLPATVPVGVYTAAAHLVRDGRVVATSISTLFVTKTGIGRTVYDFAREAPAAYGIVAVLLALAAGWMATLVFRRA